MWWGNYVFILLEFYESYYRLSWVCITRFLWVYIIGVLWVMLWGNCECILLEFYELHSKVIMSLYYWSFISHILGLSRVYIIGVSWVVLWVIMSVYYWSFMSYIMGHHEYILLEFYELCYGVVRSLYYGSFPPYRSVFGLMIYLYMCVFMSLRLPGIWMTCDAHLWSVLLCVDHMSSIGIWMSSIGICGMHRNMCGSHVIRIQIQGGKDP